MRTLEIRIAVSELFASPSPKVGRMSRIQIILALNLLAFRGVCQHRHSRRPSHWIAPCCRFPAVQPQITEIDARKAKAPPRFEVKAPQDAPNVVIVLIDDMGSGQPSAFGGPVHMPTAEKLASNGLR